MQLLDNIKSVFYSFYKTIVIYDTFLGCFLYLSWELQNSFEKIAVQTLNHLDTAVHESTNLVNIYNLLYSLFWWLTAHKEILRKAPGLIYAGFASRMPPEPVCDSRKSMMQSQFLNYDSEFFKTLRNCRPIYSICGTRRSKQEQGCMILQLLNIIIHSGMEG